MCRLLPFCQPCTSPGEDTSGNTKQTKHIHSPSMHETTIFVLGHKKWKLKKIEDIDGRYRKKTEEKERKKERKITFKSAAAVGGTNSADMIHLLAGLARFLLSSTAVSLLLPLPPSCPDSLGRVSFYSCMALHCPLCLPHYNYVSLFRDRRVGIPGGLAGGPRFHGFESRRVHISLFHRLRMSCLSYLV